ncbi:MAG: hypothetical protein NTY47_07465 [Candidatus Omnitrophica bacterium]|nr:hypothetical protein [Candidatus Omnitrophota bacterium]
MEGATVDPQVQEGKFFAVISYISFLCIITLLLKKENKFALFHAKQGLVIFVAEVVVFIISIIPLLGLLLGMAGFVIFTVFSVWGIIEAWQGKLKRLPLVAEFSDKIIL